ncbi:transposase, partial [Candidatus Gracilibacteria bacterium]|nr:transposase [Candidatus Gracilibacteria bacterium]
MYDYSQKLKILEHVNKHGIESAIDAFGVGSSSIYSWQKQLEQNHGNDMVLRNKSTRPHKLRTRNSNWDTRIDKFIQETRITHPGLTKEKVWKLLQDHNQELIDTYKSSIGKSPKPISKLPSISTVGRIIIGLKKNRQIPDWSRRVSFYAKTEKFKIKIKKKVKKKRPLKKKFYKLGERIQIDTVIIIKHGISRYIINAIDVHSRLTFSMAYNSPSSSNSKDFLIKMRQVFPFIDKESEIQNDNGSEFKKHFQDYLEKENIEQFWNYPKHPKMNTWVERFNGSVQYEFIYHNLDTLFLKDLTNFNRKLMQHLVWYNTKRPH